MGGVEGDQVASEPRTSPWLPTSATQGNPQVLESMSWSETFRGPFCSWPPCDCLLSGPLFLHCKPGSSSTCSWASGARCGAGLAQSWCQYPSVQCMGRLGQWRRLWVRGPWLIPGLSSSPSSPLQGDVGGWVWGGPVCPSLANRPKWEKLREGRSASSPDYALIMVSDCFLVWASVSSSGK